MNNTNQTNLTAMLAARNTATETAATPDVAPTTAPAPETHPESLKPLEQLEKITEIKKGHIKAFLQIASKADCEWVNTNMADCMLKHKGGSWLKAFAKPFAQKYATHLTTKKKTAENSVEAFLKECYEIEQAKPAA
jgi:hypothetical protein